MDFEGIIVMKRCTLAFLLVFCIVILCNAQNIPNIRLKTVEFNPSKFTPSTYKPANNSNSLRILQESLSRKEQRMYEAGDKYVNFSKLLGEIYMMLANDRDLQIWYSEYKKRMTSDIEKSFQAGNYQSVSRMIDERTVAILKDPLLLSRIEASQNYNSFKERVGSEFNGSLIYQWWNDTHPFIYEDCFDKSGNFVGYNSTELVMPQKDFPWFDHFIYVRDNILGNKKFTNTIGETIFNNFCLDNVVSCPDIA